MSDIPDRDGIDHINIYSRGETALGRMLSNFAHTPFILDGERFASVEGYWYYLATGSRHDVLRNAYGFGAKKMGQFFKDDRVVVEDFEARIRRALTAKFQQTDTLWWSLVTSRLPLRHYIVARNGFRVEQSKHTWQVHHWTHLRHNYGDQPWTS